MPAQETRVALRDPQTGHLHKITKFVAYKEGGFAILTPYHNARSGCLAILPVDYRKTGEFEVGHQEATEFSAADRVKLSYHPDGFVQFSSEIGGTIISGKDHTTGQPKGIGLMTNPLARPISSGPTFGLTIWGLDQFERLREGEKNTIIFEETDWYYRGCSPSEANGWDIEFFVFPERYWLAARKKHDRFTLTLSFINFEVSMGVIEMQIVELPGQPIILAGFSSRTRTSFPSTSGWVLSGPGNRNAAGLGHVLQAYYPNLGFTLTTTSLNRSKKG
jgi:hypothetical protein